MITVVTVCRGNIHRSPVAAAALRRLLDPEQFVVRSAGLSFAEGRPCPRDLLQAAREHGLDLASHRSAAITATDPADLLLPMTRQQARQLLVDHRWTTGKVIPFGELPGLLRRGSPGSDLADLVARRSSHDLLGRGPNDIADPPHDSLRVHRTLVANLVAVAEQISAGLSARR